ncbi:MAG: HAD-superfamily subfamily hydrolase [Candidatus Saccharibacteria bacterium]|nr:HAD-superfamily subfamily hydrolase [Candidatus Saccharibacteria bacterium]
MKRRQFAVFDIDGTLVRWQLYHAIADSLARLGHMDPELHQAIKSSRRAWKQRVEGRTFRDYEIEVINIYEKVIADLSAKDVDEAIDDVFEEYKDQVYTYTRELIKDLKAKEYLLFAISGSQSEVVAKIAGYYGFDDFVGSEYEILDGKFTGNKTVGSHNKDATLNKLIKKHEADTRDSIAIGDSGSDIVMLEMVEKPIAFNPDRQLFEHAKGQGWEIIIERKNMIYKLESRDGSYVLA